MCWLGSFFRQDPKYALGINKIAFERHENGEMVFLRFCRISFLAFSVRNGHASVALRYDSAPAADKEAQSAFCLFPWSVCCVKKSSRRFARVMLQMLFLRFFVRDGHASVDLQEDAVPLDRAKARYAVGFFLSFFVVEKRALEEPAVPLCGSCDAHAAAVPSPDGGRWRFGCACWALELFFSID